jgi:hypothetical protein
MYYYVPQKIVKVTYFNIDKPFSFLAQEDIASNDFPHANAKGADNFGGLFVPISGTSSTASGTANHYVHSISYVPETGPLPVVEMELYHYAKNTEKLFEIQIKTNGVVSEKLI